ncbi:MAG: DMT family transporter [[Pasteurella] mairii]|nr:DMT family transporter [[Pasteurella] mairii]
MANKITSSTYHLALLKVHFTAVLFGATGVLSVLIKSDADVLVLGRVIIAFLVLSAYFLLKPIPLTKLSPKAILFQFVLGTLLSLHWVTFYIGVKVGGVAIGTLGFASFPAFVGLFEMLVFKERLKFREFILLVCISIGLILITPEFQFTNQATQGLLWGILSGAIYAILAILNRKNAQYLSGSQASWWQYLVSVIILLPFSYHKLPVVSTLDWFWIACIGLLCTSLAYTLFVSSLGTINARTAAMIISLEPVYAIIMAWAWLDETPTLTMLLGGALIILSVAFVNFFNPPNG